MFIIADYAALTLGLHCNNCVITYIFDTQFKEQRPWSSPLHEHVAAILAMCSGR